MIGILVATHGGFADGLLNAVELIAGKQEKVKTIGLYHGDGVEEYEEKVRSAYSELDDGDGVLVFVDILNGTPSNTVMRMISENPKIRAIAGVNMPMLIMAVTDREDTSLQELCDECREAGIEQQYLMHEVYQGMIAQADDDDENF